LDWRGQFIDVPLKELVTMQAALLRSALAVAIASVNTMRPFVLMLAIFAREYRQYIELSVRHPMGERRCSINLRVSSSIFLE
jgi:hypothetical protein